MENEIALMLTLPLIFLILILALLNATTRMLMFGLFLVFAFIGAAVGIGTLFINWIAT